MGYQSTTRQESKITSSILEQIVCKFQAKKEDRLSREVSFRMTGMGRPLSFIYRGVCEAQHTVMIADEVTIIVFSKTYG